MRGETVEVEEALWEVKYSRRQRIGAVKSEKRAEDPHLEISTRNVIFHRFGLPLPQSQSSQFYEFRNDYNILVHKLFSTSERETKTLMDILCPD